MIVWDYINLWSHTFYYTNFKINYKRITIIFLFYYINEIILQISTGCDNLFTGCSCRNKNTNERKRKMKKKANLRNFKGITLIALVITIIVLLILAGVSIATLTGQNGILTQAQNAKTETEEAGEKEAISIAYTGAMAEKNGDGTVTAGDMNTQFGLNGTDAEATGSIVVTFNKSKRSYKIDSQGTIEGPYGEGEVPTVATLVEMYDLAVTDGCQGGEACTNPEGHLHIGDYVNYQNPSSGSYPVDADKTGVEWDQTYNVDSNLKWRVLGKDETTGSIKLIAETILKETGVTGENTPYFDIYGAEAYLYAPDEMNNISAIYKNEYAQEARSANINDINEALGMTDGKGNLDANKMKPYNFLVAQGAIQYGETIGPFAENNWTPEAWISGKKPQESLQDEVSGYAYFIGEIPAEAGISANGVKVENETLRSMLFDNVEPVTGNAYWLASRGVYAYSDGDYAHFGPGIVVSEDGMTVAGVGFNTFYSGGGEVDFSGYAGVRPVVILKSDINKDQIQKVNQ